jgi:hypothetical protein
MEEREGSKIPVMRCPRLGDEVPFSYCEHEGGNLPCRLVRRCWETVFPVEAYLRERLGDETWASFCSQEPKDRLTTLLDLAAQAKRRREGKG